VSTSPRAHVVTVGNVKGGVGKSTTAVQLALHAQRRGQRVLLIDADPGRSALSWATRARDSWPAELAVVAHPFADLPRRLPALAHGFDLVVIDTPHSPSEGAEVGPQLAAGIAVADELVVPTGPNLADLDRLSDMLAAVEVEQHRRDLRWHLVLTRVDLRSRRTIEQTRTALARRAPVFDAVVPQRSAVAGAFGSAVALVEYDALATEVLEADQVVVR
jgi:chromosome partitioning protein